MIKKHKKGILMSILIGIICFMIWLIANPRRIISITYVWVGRYILNFDGRLVSLY